MQNWWLMAIWLVVSLLVIAGVVWFFYRKSNPKKAKAKGREADSGRAVGVVKRWAGGHRFKTIAPAHLAGKGKFANLDAVVVGYFGILGVKTIGYNGEVYGNQAEEEWLQVAEDGTRTYFDNPISEASADVRVIRDALFAAKLKQIPVEVVCVFTSPKVQLAIPKSVGYFTPKTFKQYLQKEKFLEDTKHDLDAVEAALRAAIVQ